MKKTATLFIILILVNLSIYAQEEKKKEYVDIVTKEFYGVDNIRWGSGYGEIKGLSYVGTMGHADSIYENRNSDFGYLTSSVFSNGNKRYGFFKDRFYYLKITYEKREDAENDLKSIMKLSGNGKVVKNRDILMNGEQRVEFSFKKTKAIFSMMKDEISLRFINNTILDEKNRYVEQRWEKKMSIEGWHFLRWDMEIREVKSLLSTNDKDYMKWGWEFSPLNKSIFIGNQFFEATNSFFLEIRNSKKLKCYNIHNIKKIFFLNDELFCVLINFSEPEREKNIAILKKEYGDKVKVDEFENLSIRTEGTDIYLNNNTLYYLDLKKSTSVLAQIKKENEKI